MDKGKLVINMEPVVDITTINNEEVINMEPVVDITTINNEEVINMEPSLKVQCIKNEEVMTIVKQFCPSLQDDRIGSGTFVQ
jgi:hypothetical protein